MWGRKKLPEHRRELEPFGACHIGRGVTEDNLPKKLRNILRVPGRTRFEYDAKYPERQCEPEDGGPAYNVATPEQIARFLVREKHDEGRVLLYVLAGKMQQLLHGYVSPVPFRDILRESISEAERLIRHARET